MSVVIEFEDAGPCRKKVTVEVPAPAVEAELGRVMQDLRQRVQIDGFRRGKVPAGVIRRRFKDQIRQEVIDRLLPRYWRQAEAEKSLDVVLPPQISDLHLEEGEPMKFVAEVDLRPEFELRIDEPFELPNPSDEPGDDEIEEAIEDLRRSHGTWHAVERASAVGDAVAGTIQLLEVDGKAQVDEETGEADSPSPFTVEVSDENVWEELRLAATGLSAGQQATFERTTGTGDEVKKLKYKIEVEEVRERELPPVDDELAKKIGDFDDLPALREAVAERIRHGLRGERLRTRREKLLEELRTRHPIELPAGLVARENERAVHDQMRRMASRGIDIENTEIDWMDFAEKVKPEAEKRIHEKFVLDAVAEARDVRVDEQEFERRMTMWAAQEKTSRLALRQQLAEDGRLTEIRAQMRRERTLAQLTGEEEETRLLAEALEAKAGTIAEEVGGADPPAVATAAADLSKDGDSEGDTGP